MNIPIYDSIIDTIGKTPVIKLHHSLIPEGKELFLKLEQFNPNFSIKDRTALGLIRKAIDSGKLKPGGMIIESTSGNLGKSLAMLGAVLKFKVIVVIDPKVSSSTLNWFKAYGAYVELVSVADNNGGYQQARIARVQELLAVHQDAYWPNQYDNDHNPDFHSGSTADEIGELNVDLVASAVSTGGHLCGIARGAKRENRKTRFLACDVEGSAIFNRPFKPYLINGVGLGWRSNNMNMSLIDYKINVSDQNAISICRVFARELGLLLGGSSGLVIYGALACLNLDDVNSVVAIAPDTGINYLEQIYDDVWLAERNINLCDVDSLHNNILISSKLIAAESKL
jgi:cysteine synthase A